ncbi:MAG: hypothetical protein R3190_13525, partial [Thermoanaerobaculia bacterium]|nr:hypothetical protein [Thermoanaerobaculia bacterium]
AHELVFEDGVLRIYAAPGDPWLNERSLQRDSNRRALAEALRIVFGDGAGWKVVERDAPAAAAPAGPAAKVADEVLEDPRVQKVLDIFGGHVESVVES